MILTQARHLWWNVLESECDQLAAFFPHASCDHHKHKISPRLTTKQVVCCCLTLPSTHRSCAISEKDLLDTHLPPTPATCGILTCHLPFDCCACYDRNILASSPLPSVSSDWLPLSNRRFERRWVGFLHLNHVNYCNHCITGCTNLPMKLTGLEHFCFILYS